MRRLSSSLIMLCLATGIFAQDQGIPRDPATRLAGVLSGIDSLHARYDQHPASPTVQSGEIWIKKPDRFRVEAGPPLSQTVVSDGASLWTYDRDLEQVIISDLDTTSTEIPVLLFAGEPADITAHYEVEYLADEDREHFLLRPRDEASLLSAMSLTFEAGVASRIVVENAMQERTSITLSQQAALQEYDEGLFTFAIPDGVDVIDDRMQP